MRAPTSSSRAVNAGVMLVTVVLALTVVFGVLAVASVVVGTARHGDSLLYGGSFRVPLQLSPDDVRPLPRGVEPHGWVDVDVVIPDATTRQMWLRSRGGPRPAPPAACGASGSLRRFLVSVQCRRPVRRGQRRAPAS